MLAKTKLRYFIQPIFVKWSNLYLGIPPLIKISKAINTKNFKAIVKAFKVVVLNEKNSEFKSKPITQFSASILA